MRPVALLVALIALWSAPAAAQYLRPALVEREAVLRDVLGADPQTVELRLRGAARAVPVRPGLVIWSEQGLLSFYTMNQLVGCNVGYPVEPAPHFPNTNGNYILLAFDNDKLVAALREPQPLPPIVAPSGMSRSAAFDYVERVRRERPIQSAMISHPGALPLEDGGAFLERRSVDVLAPDTPLTLHCVPPPDPTGQSAIPPGPPSSSPANVPRGARHFDEAGFFQSLGLLPFAVTLPSLNASRARARQEGPALMATLTPGELLGQSARDFARTHRGVGYVASDDPAFSILTIDLGDEPSNNLSRRDDLGLVGVRDDRVAWMALTDNPSGVARRFMCLDAHNVARRVRHGCTDFGDFFP